MEEGMSWYAAFLIIILIVTSLKATLIGSEFNLVLWLRYGWHYRDWYFSKRVPETYIEYCLRRKE
jgi:hypothetical protein